MLLSSGNAEGELLHQAHSLESLLTLSAFCHPSQRNCDYCKLLITLDESANPESGNFELFCLSGCIGRCFRLPRIEACTPHLAIRSLSYLACFSFHPFWVSHFSYCNFIHPRLDDQSYLGRDEQFLLLLLFEMFASMGEVKTYRKDYLLRLFFTFSLQDLQRKTMWPALVLYR